MYILGVRGMMSISIYCIPLVMSNTSSNLLSSRQTVTSMLFTGFKCCRASVDDGLRKRMCNVGHCPIMIALRVHPRVIAESYRVLG